MRIRPYVPILVLGIITFFTCIFYSENLNTAQPTDYKKGTSDSPPSLENIVFSPPSVEFSKKLRPNTTQPLLGSQALSINSDLFPKKCSDIYNPTIIPKFEISIDKSSLNKLLSCDRDKKYFHIQFNMGQDTLKAMIRQKGNWSWNCEKKQFVISFNENSKGRFEGQRKIVLDAPWYDPSYLNERMSFSIMKDLGEYYSCANNAKLYINNNFYGLYANIEQLDKEYLERHFLNPTGNLYKSNDKLKTNKKKPLEEKNVLSFRKHETLKGLHKVINLKQFISQWAAQAIISDPDSWWAGHHLNSYIYDIPDSTLVMLPYDMDMGTRFNHYGNINNSYEDTNSYHTAITRDPIYHEHSYHKKEEIFKMVLRDSIWCEYFIVSLEKHYQNWDVFKLNNRYKTYVNQIKALAHFDPNKTFSNNDFDLHVAQAKHFFKDRAAYIRKWLDRGNHCPAYQ